MEAPPPSTSRPLGEEVITTPSAVLLGVEEEPLSGGMTEEVSQPMQGVQPIQNPKASQFPISQNPQPK